MTVIQFNVFITFLHVWLVSLQFCLIYFYITVLGLLPLSDKDPD